MLWMSGDLLGDDDKIRNKILLIEKNKVTGYVDGVRWKQNLSIRSSHIKKYVGTSLQNKLKTYIEKNGPLPEEGLLFSEKARKFL